MTETSPDPQSVFLSPNKLLAAIVDSSDDAIISKNLKGIVTSWNRGAQRIFGYEAEEMVGQPILRLLPADRQNEEVKILETLKRGERVDHFETIRLRKDGAQINVSLTISPIRDAEGVIVGASKIARDITEQRESIRRLAEANEALARADRMKVEFISTLSHELRTPLTAMVGWIQMLKEGASPDETKQAVEVIERNIRVQSQLINDLLDMSRIEAGKMILDVQRLELAETANAAIDAVRPAAEAKDIHLTSAFAELGGVVMGDRNRLQQILWNLLNNAIKFTPKRGRVHVTIGRVKPHVEIAVADNGMGIAPEYLPLIFERFSQADASTTRRYGGLGLGLSIAKHLTELHGGTITVASTGKNSGATFCVKIPLVSAHHEHEHTTAELRSAEVDSKMMEENLAGVRILLVEDDSDSAEVVRRILERREALVQTATSMEEALAAFQKSPPHVLLSDIGLPGHDGYELISRVRALPGGQTVPAVALTALARSEDRTRALRAGFQLHIAKPVEPAELIAVVRNLANLRAGQP